MNRIGIVEQYTVFKTSGSIKVKERTQTGTPKWASAVNEMGNGQRPIICQVLASCSLCRLQQGGVPGGAVH